MNLQDKTVAELTTLYNQMAKDIGREELRPAKDKPTALERLARIKSAHDEWLEAQKPKKDGKPKTKRSGGWLHPMKDYVVYPKPDKDGNKGVLLQIIDALRVGATETQIGEIILENDRLEGKTCKLPVRVRILRHFSGIRVSKGFGMRCDGNPRVDPIYLIEPEQA